MAGWVTSAGAGLPPLPPPPVTIPTPTIPAVTVPTVTVPPVPQPPVVRPPQTPPPPPLPRVTLPAAQPSLPLPAAADDESSGGAEGTAAPGSSPVAGGPGRVSAQGRRPGASRARTHSLHLTRDWISITGSKKQRRTTLIFVLREPALVELVVVRVSPDCRRIGRFRVRGHRGVNRIRLRASIQGHSLLPGTYRYVARALPARRTVADTRLVVVQRSSRREIRAARHANACPQAANSGSSTISGTTGRSVGSPPEKAGSTAVQRQPARERGVRGTRFARHAFSAVREIPVWLIALATLALGLILTAAQLPKAAPRELAAALGLGMTCAAIILLLTIAIPLL